MRRFYAPPGNFHSETITLDLEETRHLRDVLRLREGAEIQIFDGGGKEFSCTVRKISKKETELTVLKETVPRSPESSLDLTLSVALLKGEKFDFVIQKAVELGVTKFVPLNTERADVKLKDGEKKMERWRKIVVEATKQCGRARLMEIETPVDFKEFIASAKGTRILFAENSGESFSSVKNVGKIVAVTGAEGGWETAEIEAARENGFQIVTFGGRILRAETAAISIAGILQHRFGDLA